MFRQVHVSLNDRLITSSGEHYAYVSYLQALLNYSKEAKESHLTSALWYQDTAANFDALTNANAGFQKRKTLVAGSGMIDMIGKLNSDFMNQDRLLINKVGMRIKLFLQAVALCLMAALILLNG